VSGVVLWPAAIIPEWEPKAGIEGRRRGLERIAHAKYLSEVFCQFSFISMTNSGEHITLEVCHTILERGPREDLSQRNFKIYYSIGNKEAYIFHPSFPQYHKHLLPSGGTLT